jgi:hypothetical protein
MQTQKDHVHAYAFQAGRMSAALVTGEAAYLEVPARRAKLGIIVGIAVSALIVVGFFLFGLIKHQTEQAKQGATRTTPTSVGTALVPGRQPGQG